MAFKRFRSNQPRDITSDTSEGAMERLRHDSNDLNALLELRDIDDELGILDKLFNEQLAVLKKMMPIYNNIDKRKSRQSNGAMWLKDAASQVENYQSQVSAMRASCSASQEAVRTKPSMSEHL